eukprot:SAG11_NODE_11_length_27870_cov_16.327428_20_plen_104_part_00
MPAGPASCSRTSPSRRATASPSLSSKRAELLRASSQCGVLFAHLGTRRVAQEIAPARVGMASYPKALASVVGAVVSLLEPKADASSDRPAPEFAVAVRRVGPV